MPDTKTYQSKEEYLKTCTPKAAVDTPPANDSTVPKQNKSKLELLTEFKKNVEKNGFKIKDTMLESLLQHIEAMGEIPQLKRLTLALDLKSGTEPQWIKIFPKKKCYFEKYDTDVDFNDQLFDDMIKNFKNDKLFKPYMDVDHELKEKYSDILGLEKREDGLYALLKLNQLGLEAIKNNKYSYISPEWGPRVDTEKKLHKNVLWAVTLTNIPAFEGELPMLQEQMRLSKKRKGYVMKNTKLISLAADLKKLNFKHSIELAEPQEGQPVDNTAVIEEAILIIQDLQVKLQEAIGAKDQAEEQVNEMKKIEEAKEMNSFIENAIELGKIEPKEQDLYIKLWKTNKEDVKALIDVRPAKKNIKLSSGVKDDTGLTKEDYDIMDKQGYVNSDGTYKINEYKKAIGE